MSTKRHSRAARACRTRGLVATASLVAVAAVASACGSNVGGGSQSVFSPDYGEHQNIFTAGPEPGDAFGPSPSAAPSSSRAAPSSSPANSGQSESLEVSTIGTLGPVLVSSAGRTVYLFTADHDRTSSCHSACAKMWLPVTTRAAPHATGKLSASLLATTMRRNGQKQVVYAGHPLYYFAPDDHRPHSAKGEGLTRFGGRWYAVSSQGMAVRKPGS